MQTFDPTQFKADFPVFAGLSDGYLTGVFDNAVMTIGRVIWGLFISNTNAEYYWATWVLAHILTLTNGQNGMQNGISKVGQTTDAAEGDVSGSFNYPSTLDAAWWNQTQFGATCYNLLKQHGGMTYYAQNAYNGYKNGWGGIGRRY